MFSEVLDRFYSILEGVIMNINMLAILFFIIGFLLLVFSITSFKKLSNSLILIFSLMTFGMSIFAFGYSWELLSTSESSSLLSINQLSLILLFELFGNGLASFTLYKVGIFTALPKISAC